jgi:ATP-binding cassette, subfamily C (CFTR/MRP), member 1
VYAQKDIVIIDDALSGLDAETENHVWNSLLGRDGLLRRFHSTTIVASSSAKRLPYADHIVVLDKNGTTAEQGTFEQLNNSGGYVSTFTLTPPSWDYVPEDMSDLDLTSYSSNAPQQGMTEDSLEEDAARRTGDVAVYLYYIRSVGWVAAWIFIISVTIFTFCNSFPREYPLVAIKEHPLTNRHRYVAEMVGSGERSVSKQSTWLLARDILHAREHCHLLFDRELLVRTTF